MSARPDEKIAVLAVGNVLMRDDAVGPYVLQELISRFEMPPTVTVEDLGTPGLDLHPHLMDLDAAIFIDAIRSGDEPGTVRCYEREELFSVGPAQRTGPHDPALRDTLLSLEFNGRAPAQIYLVGVVPATVDYGIGLSEAVQQAIPNAVEQVCSTLRMLGHETRPRPETLPANRWWEDGASNPKASARR